MNIFMYHVKAIIIFYFIKFSKALHFSSLFSIFFYINIFKLFFSRVLLMCALRKKGNNQLQKGCIAKFLF